MHVVFQEKLTFDTDWKSLVGILDAHHRFIEAERRDMEARGEQNRTPPTEEFVTALKAYVEYVSSPSTRGFDEHWDSIILSNLDATKKQMEFWDVQMKELALKYEMTTQSDVIKGLENELSNSFCAFMVRGIRMSFNCGSNA